MEFLQNLIKTDNIAIVLCIIAIAYLAYQNKELENKFDKLHKESTTEILKLSIEVAKIKGRKDGAEVVANKLAKELNVKIDKLAKIIDKK